MMKQVIGRKEKISIPEWGLTDVKGKVDTGAYTSSIHSDYAEEAIIEGKSTLTFTVLSKRYPKYKNNVIQTTRYVKKKVKNSFGQEELRYQVFTSILLRGKEIDAEFTLSDRSKMKNPILLGRKILKGRFIVDVDLPIQRRDSKKNNSEKL